MARAAARIGLEIAEIAHSGKRRAQETAEILAAQLKPARGLTHRTGLAPLDDPAIAQRAMDQATDSQMLVGHLPHLSRLTSLLLVGDPARQIAAFRMGGIVCLDRAEGVWRVKWILTPELVAQ